MTRSLNTLFPALLLAAATAGADGSRTAQRHGDGHSSRSCPGSGCYRQGSGYPRGSHGARQTSHDRSDCACDDDRHDHHRPDHRDGKDATGEMLVGGVVGGLLGNAISAGSNRTQGTIVGAIPGTAIGYGAGRYGGPAQVVTYVQTL